MSGISSLHILIAHRQADYAEERLDAQPEFQEELDQALLLRKMVEMGLHDRALERLMAVTEVIHNITRVSKAHGCAENFGYNRLRFKNEVFFWLIVPFLSSSPRG